MGNVREKINPCIIEIQTVLKEFMDRVSEFQKLGVDIPMNVILEQLNNMVSGMEYGDMILLADTLEYEIKKNCFVNAFSDPLPCPGIGHNRMQ